MQAFVNGFDSYQLQRVFQSYERGQYDHLLKFHRLPIDSDEEKRNALRLYIENFGLIPRYENEDDYELEERYEVISDFVRKGDRDGLITKLRSDQYFQEPLMHIMNQGTAKYIL